MHESMHYLLLLQGSLNVYLGERGFWAFIQCKACVHLPMWTRTGPQKGVDVFIFFSWCFLNATRLQRRED